MRTVERSAQFARVPEHTDSRGQPGPRVSIDTNRAELACLQMDRRLTPPLNPKSSPRALNA